MARRARSQSTRPVERLALPFHPVRTRRTTDDVVAQIVDAIRSGKIAEGDVLPGERVLAVQFEVSRPTIRLAVARLVDAGVLDVALGRSGSPRVLSMWIPDHLVMRPEATKEADEIFRLLEARRVVEPRVAQLAATRGTGKHFKEMESAITLQRRHANNRLRAGQAESLFHRTMWRAADNATLEDMLVSLFKHLEVVRDMMMRTESDAALAVTIHENTLAALMQGESGDVDAAMDEHLGHLEHVAQDVLGRRNNRHVPEFLLSSRPRAA